jgi:O-antigen ligase
MMRFFGEKNPTLRLIALISGVLSAIGMVLAFSRGAAVAFVLLLLLMTAFQVIRPKQMLGFIGVALIVMMLIPEYSQRIMSIPSVTSLVTGETTGGEDAPDGAVRGRLTEMLSAARVYSDHPVFGVGPAMFQYYSREYSREIGLRNLMGNRESHSLYLGMAAELGTVGIGLFLLMVVVTVRELYRARRRAHALSRPELENLATMFILAIMAYMTTAIFLHFSFQRYFWLIFGLASAAEYIIHKELDKLEQPVLRPAQIEENYINDAI